MCKDNSTLNILSIYVDQKKDKGQNGRLIGNEKHPNRDLQTWWLTASLQAPNETLEHVNLVTTKKTNTNFYYFSLKKSNHSNSSRLFNDIKHQMGITKNKRSWISISHKYAKSVQNFFLQLRLRTPLFYNMLVRLRDELSQQTQYKISWWICLCMQ